MTGGQKEKEKKRKTRNSDAAYVFIKYGCSDVQAHCLCAGDRKNDRTLNLHLGGRENNGKRNGESGESVCVATCGNYIQASSTLVPFSAMSASSPRSRGLRELALRKAQRCTSNKDSKAMTWNWAVIEPKVRNSRL